MGPKPSAYASATIDKQTICWLLWLGVARTLKPDEFAARRLAIVLAAQRLVVTRGYAHVSLHDLLDELHISAGAFHHYFDSRAALLDALVDHIQDESVQRLVPIIRDPELTAIQKLQECVSVMERVCTLQQQDALDAVRLWYAKANAVVRQRADDGAMHRQALLLGELVGQGVREGVFETSLPEHVGEVVMALLRALRDACALQRLSMLDTSLDTTLVATLDAMLVATSDATLVATEGWRVAGSDVIAATHAAYMQAIERVLGAAPLSLRRLGAERIL